MNSNANAVFTPVVVEHLGVDDYSLQHSQQNATVDFKPPIEIEELYVQQFVRCSIILRRRLSPWEKQIDSMLRWCYLRFPVLSRAGNRYLR
jgi:hypothetical protein